MWQKHPFYHNPWRYIKKIIHIYIYVKITFKFSKPIEMSKHLHGRCKCCFYFYFSYTFFFLLFLFSTLYLYCPSTRWIFFTFSSLHFLFICGGFWLYAWKKCMFHKNYVIHFPHDPCGKSRTPLKKLYALHCMLNEFIVNYPIKNEYRKKINKSYLKLKSITVCLQYTSFSGSLNI